MNRVKDKIAIITGVATGLGRAQALLLAKERAKVVVTDIDETEGEKVIEEVRRGSHEVLLTNPKGLADKIIEAGRD